MRTLAIAFAFALPLIFATPGTVNAEGECPGSWDVWVVPYGWPADINENGIVCGKYQYAKADDGFTTLRMKDDR